MVKELTSELIVQSHYYVFYLKFPTLRHNENVTAAALSEVCHDVVIEPVLQPLSEESLPNLRTVYELQMN